MPVFDQMGDPVCPPALCQHHEAAYVEWTSPAVAEALDVNYQDIANGVTIVSVPITITETCCITVNAAMLGNYNIFPSFLEIERPVGTIRTQQEDMVNSNFLRLTHHAAWEVLAPGAYTYYLVNRAGVAMRVYAAWIKAIASDCEG